MINNIVNNQHENRIHNIRLGLFPMSFNGCEVIAVHNALLLMDIDSDLEKLVAKFKKNHLVILFGLFGSRVKKLHRVFHAPVNVNIINRKNKDTAFFKDGVYIISFWNTNPPFHGIHTVAMQVKNGQFFTYNLYSNTPSPMNISPSVFAGKRFIIGYSLKFHP